MISFYIQAAALSPVDHDETCTYQEEQQRRRKRKEREQDTEDRLARMEMVLRAATRSAPKGSDQRPTVVDIDARSHATTTASPGASGADPGTDPGADNADQGPASYLSICSFSAVEWVSRRIGIPDFLASAKRLSKDVSRGECLNRIIDPSRTPEPDMETAFKWTNVYFETCLDSVFAVPCRQDFMARLRVIQFEPDPDQMADKPWYALRNTVYTSGCRVSLSKESSPAAFSESRTQSWKYFENALAVHTDLVYGRTDLTWVRALLMMAFHAETLGSPALEYMLLSNATRLAQSKGLHLLPPQGSRFSPEEITSRQWLWWILYSYEKHVAYRSGRPSVRSCNRRRLRRLPPLPASSGFGGLGPVNPEFATATVNHAQTSSRISKKLTTAKALRKSPEEMAGRAQDLEHRLHQRRKSLPPNFSSPPRFKGLELPPGDADVPRPVRALLVCRTTLP
ncbi:hypothetical protein MKZ38_008661 [Zalerion maritima]|uniref:Xylanolytic transcriptional activator regulatory domain-containing protein n=1 Tax=Zalerion maritima TaxID=339359 RepID=A0AAD5RHE3_9PEZI|nr:hypothetical protein MKZ38_008661 [Zalerion maritima]